MGTDLVGKRFEFILLDESRLEGTLQAVDRAARTLTLTQGDVFEGVLVDIISSSRGSLQTQIVHAVVLYGTEGRAAARGKEEKAFNRKYYDTPLQFPGKLFLYVPVSLLTASMLLIYCSCPSSVDKGQLALHDTEKEILTIDGSYIVNVAILPRFCQREMLNALPRLHQLIVAPLILQMVTFVQLGIFKAWSLQNHFPILKTLLRHQLLPLKHRNHSSQLLQHPLSCLPNRITIPNVRLCSSNHCCFACGQCILHLLYHLHNPKGASCKTWNTSCKSQDQAFTGCIQGTDSFMSMIQI
jgi:hypothetical protein